MKATTKKIYSLASAILLVVLSVLLFVGALMPMFTVNMANITEAEGFKKGYFTSNLEVDEAKISFGGALKLLSNKKYVSLINKYQMNEQTVRKATRYMLQHPSAGNLETYYSKIEAATQKNEALLDSMTDADWDALTELFKDESFIEALYLEIGFVSLFSDIFSDGNEENYIYTSNNVLAVFTMIFGMIFLAGFMICMVIFTIIAFFSALKKVIALATGFKKIDLKKLESFYPEKTLTTLLPTFLFFTLTKAMMGSKLMLGAGLKLVLIAFILISVLRAANKIMLKERRNPKHIARVLVGLLSFIFVLCIFNNVTNMGLVESYYRSNDVNVETAYDAKYEEVYAEELLRQASNNNINLDYAKSTAKAQAQEHVTKILVKNALPLLGLTFALSILTFILFSLSFNRLRENSDDFKSTYSAEKYGAHYVVAALLLVAVFFTSMLGVATVDERNNAYFGLDGGVKILWNDYTLEGSGTKEEYDEITEERAELLEEIEAAKTEIAEIEDEELKAEYEFEIQQAERYANKLAMKLAVLENSAAARRTKTMILLVVLIVLEILYQIAPKLTDKVLPEGAKRFLAGPDDEEIDTSLCEEPVAAAAPAAPAAPAYEAPAAPAYSAPAGDAPAKEKSFKQEEEPAPATAGEDDLAAQMQRMFDNQ